MVLIFDMNMWKNQIFYEPFPYGQYTDADDKIYTVMDAISLETHNETQVNYEWRSVNINPLTNETYISGDFKMNSKFTNSTLSTRGLAFIPSLAAFLMFFLFVWFFGRAHPTEDDRHAGRLQKRKKGIRGKFSLRGIRSSLRSSFTRRSGTGRHESVTLKEHRVPVVHVPMSQTPVSQAPVSRAPVSRAPVATEEEFS